MRGRLARGLKRAGRISLIVLGGIVALVAVALGLLSTRFGGEQVRRVVLPRINQAIVGQIEVARLRTGLGGVELEDVVLLDPAGKPVARIDRMVVRFALLRLLRRELELKEITIERPRLWLVAGPAGLNLSRALAARNPKPPPPPGGPPPDLAIDLRRFRIIDGALAYRDLGAKPSPAVRVRGLNSEASGRFALRSQTFRGRLSVEAQSEAPVASPFVLRAEADGAGPKASGHVHLAFADTRLDAELASRDARTQTLTLTELVVSPRLVRAFAPTARLAAPIEIEGRVDRQGEGVGADLALSGGGARGSVRGHVDLGRLVGRDIKVELRGVNLARLVQNAPSSRFDLDLEGSGGGRDLARASGAIALRVPAGTLGGRPLGPIRIEARADRGNYVVSRLEGALPGVSLTGRGRGTSAAFTGELRVAARDLALTGKSLNLPLALAGQGELAVKLGGSFAAPSLAATGQFPSLRFGENRVSEVGLAASSPNLRSAPAASSARLTVKSARLGGQELRNFDVKLAGQGDAVRLALTTAGPLPLSLTADARMPAGLSVIELKTFALRYPEATWRLARPARITSIDERLAIEGLELAAPPNQTVKIDLSKRGERIRANALIAGFDLARLPALIHPGQRLAGQIDAKIEASGRLPTPEAAVEVSLSGGVVGKWRDLALSLKAHHRAGRLAGTLNARALGAAHAAEFDLPARWPAPPSAPVRLNASLGQIDLAALAALGKSGRPLKGFVSAAVGLEGRAGDPSFTLNARGRQLALGRERIDALALDVRDPAGAPLRLDARVDALGRTSTARIETPIVLGQWLRRPPDPDELVAAPFRLLASVDEVPLGGLDPRPPERRLGGTVSMNADLAGPFTRLAGGLTVRATEVRAPGLPPTSGQLVAKLSPEKGIDADLFVTRRGQRIASLTAAVGASIDDLVRGRALARAPLRIKAHAGPALVQRLVAPSETGPGARRPFRSNVTLDVNASGSLGDPRADVRLVAQDVHLAGRPLGGADLRLRYDNARPTVDLRMQSVGGGDLVLSAQAEADLSMPGLARGLDVKQIPIRAKLTSHGLNLVFLSGLTDAVRIVEGRLDADASLAGRVGAPQIAGRVAWNGGRVLWAGLGDFRDIQLALRGDQREMVLERLFARAGAGTANITAKAVRRPDGRSFDAEARTDIKKFRLQAEGQPLGDLSLAATVSGVIAPERIGLATTIDEAHLELSEGDRRKLQSLKRPDDIVLVADGEPLDRGEKKRLEKLLARAAARDAPQSARSSTKVALARASDDVRRIRTSVDAPRNIWVRGADVNLEIGLDPGFVVIYTDEPRVFGTVRLRRGFVEVLGRRFDLSEDSSVRFSGPTDQPRLAVDATYKVESAATTTTVAVHVEGTPTDMRFTLTSPEHPEYGDTELMSLIATGRLPDERGAGASAGTQAASFLGGLLADRLQKALTARLPIDVLTIQPGENLSGTRLEAGTYLGDDVYVAYVGRVGGDPMGRENRNEVHLEYQLTSRWSFQATYGDARQGSVDLIWTKNY